MKNTVVWMVAIIVTLTGVIFVIQSNSMGGISRTLDWNQCKESSYFNYQFMYPKIWSVTFVGSGSGAADLPANYQSSCEGAEKGLTVSPQSDSGKSLSNAEGFSIEPYSLVGTVYESKVKTLNDYVSVVVPYEGYSKTVVKQIRIGNVPAIVFSDGSIVSIHNDSVYEMQFGGKTSSTTENDILNSFTFLK